jgi:hypothetical protein
MQNSNDYDPGADEEGDISDDPLLSALDAELSRASKKTDNTLLVVLLGIGLPSMLAFQVLGSGITRTMGVIAAAVVMISAIPFTMLRTVRLRRQIATRYGLKCPSCGHNPGGMYALSTATVRQCRKCRAKLLPVVPSMGR